MTTQALYWGDGTSDKITVTFSGSVGSSQAAVASAPNKTRFERVRIVKLKAGNGVLLATFTITQKARSQAYSVAYTNAYK